MQNEEMAMDGDVLELTQVLKNNGMKQAAENIKDTMEYIDSLENKLDEMIAQVEQMRTELKAYSDYQNRSLGEKIKDEAAAVRQKVVETVKERIDSTLDRLHKLKADITEAKDKFINGCKDALTAIKSRGKQGLDKLIALTHIKQVFVKMKASVEQEMALTENMTERLTELDNALREAKQQKKNAFRAFRGKEIQDPDYSRDSVLNSLVIKPLIHEAETYDAIARMLGKGIEKMDELSAEVQEFKKSRAEKKEEKDDARKRDREEVHTEMPLGVSVAEKEFRYGDDAFEDYAKKFGIDEKKPMTPEPQVPKKKPLKK